MFRFIFPNLSRIEEETFSGEEIKNSYNHYLGFVFGKVVRKLLIELNKDGNLSFEFTKVGR